MLLMSVAPISYQRATAAVRSSLATVCAPQIEPLTHIALIMRLSSVWTRTFEFPCGASGGVKYCGTRTIRLVSVGGLLKSSAITLRFDPDWMPVVGSLMASEERTNSSGAVPYVTTGFNARTAFPTTDGEVSDRPAASVMLA